MRGGFPPTHFSNAANASAGASGFTFENGWTGTGSFTDGQIVSVSKSGGGLGLRTDERPLIWLPGNSFTQDATYSRSANNLGGAQFQALINTSIQPTNSAGCIEQDWPTTGGPGAPTWGYFATSNPFARGLGGTRTTFLKRRKNFYPYRTGGFSYNDKCWRCWPLDFGGAPDVYCMIGADFANNQGLGKQVCEGWTNANDATSPVTNTDFPINFTINQWMQHEHLFKQSSDGVYDGIFIWMINSMPAMSPSINWQTRDSGAEPGGSQIVDGVLDQYSNQATTGPFTGENDYIADWYDTDTLAAFFISTESTIDSTTLMTGTNDVGIIREVQIPTASSGSDSGCGLLIRKGTYSALNAGKYLWFRYPDGRTYSRVGHY